MCECITEVNKKLEPHGGRLAMGIGIRPDMTVYGRLLVRTEKIDNAKRKPVPVVTAAYCPFCGVKAEG